MDALFIMLKNVIVFVLLAVPGFVLVKTKQLKAEQSGALSKLLTYVGMPFLVVTSSLKLSFNGGIILTLLAVAVIGAGYTFLAFFLSKPLTAKEKNEKTRGMMRFAGVFSNNGFLGLPLVSAVFGADSPVLMVAIVLNIVNNLLMYTLGIYLISGDKKMISLKKALLNPIVFGFIIGIVLNVCKASTLLPETASYANHFSAIVTPISMTILGMKLGEIRFNELFTSVKVYYAAFLKLVLLPLGVTGIALALRGIIGGVVTTEAVLGLFIAFAMPTAGLASTFSDSFDGDTHSAVTFTLGSTVLSVAVIPLLYWLVTLLCG